MVCPKCGFRNPEGNRFCAGCGESFVPGYAQQPPYQQQQQARMRPVPPSYVVLQVVLKEKLFGTGSRNLSALEGVINEQAEKGYRLHTITTATGGSSGIGGGDRIQATMVFEKM
ncbi:MAG: DUF4177 domain-containing protein [Oscillospiraceae bacterium]|jgi:hypothetical protein|nr:DUF4177 domain-containing protein [Oscillospiraceae bacterium]